MLRVSKYNIYLPFEKSSDCLLIQGARGSFDIVDNKIAEILQNADKIDDQMKKLPEDVMDTLKRRGYITELSETEEFDFIRKLSQAINRRGRRTISVTLLPTYNCNFRCEYCFERNLQKNGKNWLNAKMDKKTVDSVFEQLHKYIEEGYVVEGIYLFGGEPLLKNNIEIVTYICEKAAEKKLPISCISNGYNLEDYIELIKKHNFKYIQITVDGIGAEHDKRRYLVGGQGTYAKIMENVDLALNSGIKVVLRTNVNKKNIKEIKRLIDNYKARGWTGKENFSYYFKSTMKCYDELKDAYSDVELMKELSSEYGEDIEKFRFNSIYNAIADKISFMLKNNTFAPMRSGYCGANMGMYTVDPFGDIYPCWDVLSDKEEVIGRVDTEHDQFVFNENHSKWKERTVDKIEQCKECKYMLFCGGGCSAQAKVMNNDINKVFCDDFQMLFDQVSREVCEEYLCKENRL